MPLAYAHIVQVLVDCVLLFYPLMAFSSGMSPLLGVCGTGLLTTSYQGLFDLAKQFLDPYDNENYGRGEDPLCVDTLIAETNAGSLRWMYGFEQFPVSAQRIKDGELFDYLLPVRGYTVEELEKIEEERLRKEIELKDLREREEVGRLKAAEDLRLRLAEEGARKEEKKEYAEVQVASKDPEDETSRKRKTEGISKQGNDLPAVEALTNYSTPASKQSNVTVAGANRLTKETVEEDKSGSTAHKIYVLDNGLPVKQASVVRTNSATSNNQTSSQANGDDVFRTIPVDTFDVANESIQSFNEAEGTVEKIKDSPLPVDANRTPRVETNEDEEGRTGQKLHEAGEGQLEGDEPDLYALAFDDFDSFSELPWFDEVGPDGQEIRLSQSLADEEWDEEKAYSQEQQSLSNPLTLEEYSRRIGERKEEAENELIETEQILMASPGAQGGELLLAEKSPRTPMYDQTKLDGISQLWGLPPEDFDNLPGSPLAIDMPDETTTFDGVSQLWGYPSSASTAEAPKIVGAGSFDSISTLWGETLEDTASTTAEEIDSVYNIDAELDLAAYEGFEWHDNGNGDRLSQILADEDWVHEKEGKPQEPVTLEDYTKKVVEILEAAEDEIKETEAILNAPPGADSVTVAEDDDDKRTASQANGTAPSGFRNDNLKDVADEEEEDLDLDALGMDIEPGEVGAADDTLSSRASSLMSPYSELNSKSVNATLVSDSKQSSSSSVTAQKGEEEGNENPGHSSDPFVP